MPPIPNLRPMDAKSGRRGFEMSNPHAAHTKRSITFCAHHKGLVPRKRQIKGTTPRTALILVQGYCLA